MLHEAPTVVKAITKAWEESGQPSEFTIKILEPGKKGFLWFSKHSAIVSISYDPRKQVKKTVQPRKKETSKPQKVHVPQKKRSVQQQSDERGKRSPRDRNQKSRHGQQQKKDFVTERWTDDWISNVNNNLKEIMSIIKIPTKFTTKAEKKTLHINFAQNLLPTAEEERLLFISLSYLLIQFLKKKYKKKLRGFHLVIKSKRQSGRDK